MAITHHDALTTTGTVTAAGISVSGVLSLGGAIVGNASVCGVRKIATGGSATISVANTGTGVIIATPLFAATTGTAPRRRIVTVVNRSASAFKVLLSTPSGTAVTGTVQWMVVKRT